MTVSAPRVLIATFGSLGDLHPFMALAHALTREGFAPVIATSEAYRDYIAADGLDFAPIRPDADDLTSDLGMDLGGFARRMAEDDAFLFEKLIFPYLRESYDDLTAASEGAALVVAHSLAFSARLVAEKRGLPLVNVLLSPLMLYSAYDPPLGSRIPFRREPTSPISLAYNRCLLRTLSHAVAWWAKPLRQLRRDVGLPRRHGLDLLLGDKVGAATIGLFSPLLAPPRPDYSPRTLIAGHTFHDRPSAARKQADGEIASALADFLAAGPAPIVFTLGSFVVRDRLEHYRACVEAVRTLQRRAVLLVHENDLAALREGLPPNVLVHGYAPYTFVFPHACAVVHHGGIGAAGQALRAGAPQLVTPFLGDQFDNAERLRRLGVARVVRGDAVSAQSLAHELAVALSGRVYATRARSVSAIVAKEDGASVAAKRIVQVLRG